MSVLSTCGLSKPRVQERCWQGGSWLLWIHSLQMVGAVGGALAILEVMPKKYKHMLGGPKLKVPVETGVVAEAVLTFAITLIVLWAILRGPRNPVVKTFIIIGATIALVMAGGAYTGPAMNPANVSVILMLLSVIPLNKTLAVQYCGTHVFPLLLWVIKYEARSHSWDNCELRDIPVSLMNCFVSRPTKAAWRCSSLMPISEWNILA